MWYAMANLQRSYELSDRLIRAISNWQALATVDDDVELLLEMGADVNRLHGTLLPLHCACMASDAECAELLIERGAEVEAIDGYGRSAIHYAAERDLDCLQLLIQNGADVNSRDANQATSLHWSTFTGRVENMRELLSNGADVDAVDFNNCTAISWASMKGNMECMSLLLDYNANVDISNHDNLTPLMRSARVHASGLNTERDDACLELLIAASGQFEVRDQDGNLPAVLAADRKLCELLLKQCRNVRTLKDLCLYQVRRQLGKRYLPDNVIKLPIPPRLQQSLLLRL